MFSNKGSCVNNVPCSTVYYKQYNMQIRYQNRFFSSPSHYMKTTSSTITNFYRVSTWKSIISEFSPYEDMLFSFHKYNGYRYKKAVIQRCSEKKVFLEISQNSQENAFVRVSFLIKLHASGLQLYLKKRLWHRFFCVYFVKFLRSPFFIEHLWWLLLDRGHPFMTSTKNDQFFDPATPTIRKNIVQKQ